MNSTQLKSLLTLQQKDLTLIQLKKEATQIPARQETIRKNAQFARDAAQAADSVVKTCESAIKQIELEVEATQTQTNKYKTQQMQAKTNEEYKAFDNQIATAGEKIGELEDQELGEMTRLDDVKADLVKAKNLEQNAEDKVNSDIKDLDARMEVIKTTFEEIKVGRDDLVNLIDKEIFDNYMRLLNKNQDAVFVPIRQKGCGGCHMKLTPQTLHDAHSQQKWTTCNFCGRLLYDDGE